MATRKLMVLAVINLVWLADVATAQEKVDEAKLVAEKFAKEWIQEGNVVAAMKLTSVPLLVIELGREPKKIEKSEELEKLLREVEFKTKATIGKISDTTGDKQHAEAVKDVFNPKSDRIFVIHFTQEVGVPFDLLTVVGRKEDRFKVVGLGLFYSR